MSLPKAIKAKKTTAQPGFPPPPTKRETLTHRRRVNVRSADVEVVSKMKERPGGGGSQKRRRPRGLNTPSRANPGTARCSQHTSILFTRLPPYLGSTRRRPLSSSRLSLRTEPPTFTDSADRDPGSGNRLNSVFCQPTTVGASRAEIPPPPRHNSSIVPRVPPGPKPRRLAVLARVCSICSPVAPSGPPHPPQLANRLQSNDQQRLTFFLFAFFYSFNEL